MDEQDGSQHVIVNILPSLWLPPSPTQASLGHWNGLRNFRKCGQRCDDYMEAAVPGRNTVLSIQVMREVHHIQREWREGG